MLKCVAIALLALLLVNLMAFGIVAFQTDRSNGWSYAYDDFMFFVNGKPAGLVWKSTEAILLTLTVFSLALYRSYKKGKLIFSKPDN